VLFLSETHSLSGAGADDFEAAWRGQLKEIAADDDARLLWFMHHAHGTGPSYVVVTVTALRDGSAWERHMQRIQDGDLRSWAREIDALRYDASSKLLKPVAWSKLQDVDFDEVPTDGSERASSIYMEDSGRPFAGKLDDYMEAAGTLYARDTIDKRLEQGTGLLDLRACFRTVTGEHSGRELILWQRVTRPELLVPLLTREVSPEHRGPGTWMHEALAFRDRWESRLLRTATWSPLD
jgi:hypothetical protein